MGDLARMIGVPALAGLGCGVLIGAGHWIVGAALALGLAVAGIGFVIVRLRLGR